MTKKKSNKTTYVIIAILFVIIGALILFFVNNRTNQEAYDFISCTWNKHDCNITDQGHTCPDWNGECTGEIKDECCTPIRACNNQIVQNPNECYSYYCYEQEQYCKPTWLIQGGYQCGCSSIETYTYQ